MLSDVRQNEERQAKDGLVEEGSGDTFFFLTKTGLRLGAPTGSFLNRRDELHSGWTGYTMVLEGILERLASTPPDFIGVVVRAWV